MVVMVIVARRKRIKGKHYIVSIYCSVYIMCNISANSSVYDHSRKHLN